MPSDFDRRERQRERRWQREYAREQEEKERWQRERDQERQEREEEQAEREAQWSRFEDPNFLRSFNPGYLFCLLFSFPLTVVVMLYGPDMRFLGMWWNAITAWLACFVGYSLLFIFTKHRWRVALERRREKAQENKRVKRPPPAQIRPAQTPSPVVAASPNLNQPDPVEAQLQERLKRLKRTRRLR